MLSTNASRPKLSLYESLRCSIALSYSSFSRSLSFKARVNAAFEVKRLESLEFIEPVKTKNTKHRAIYYRISEAGMFQLFTYRIYPILASSLHTILVNNGNYSIFETFLYPYFRKETLTVTEPNYAIRLAIVNYLNACCTAAHSLTTSYEEHNSLEAVEGYISGLKNELVMKILILFGFYTKGKGMDDLPILAKDDKFMKVADDVHKHFKRSSDIALALRNRSWIPPDSPLSFLRPSTSSLKS